MFCCKGRYVASQKKFCFVFLRGWLKLENFWEVAGQLKMQSNRNDLASLNFFFIKLLKANRKREQKCFSLSFPPENFLIRRNAFTLNFFGKAPPFKCSFRLQ